MRACGSSMARSSPWELRLTPRARADLEDIWQYTAETWSVEQADRYIESLSGTFEALLAMPEMARERSELPYPFAFTQAASMSSSTGSSPTTY
ncbi:type II toxin-antitoxin system RelE/ParE family toxin [Sinorhizobium fredii]|uniref:type II toxin-antitoxin system RelE/ParE family toxin n=1 Tax=Rhizobium fredii TaxID=380 RepID=UPI003514352A